MNLYAQIGSAVLLICSLSGCVIAIGGDGHHAEEGWQQRQEANAAYIQDLYIGQSMISIESDLGEPDFSDSFQRDGDIFTVLYYRTQRFHKDGETSMDETTPLVFIDDELVGWGESAIDKATR